MSYFYTRILPAQEPNSFQQAIQLIGRGGLVAFPTDTVYGLGANVFNAEAIDLLYKVKGREGSKAIAVLLGNQDDLKQLTIEMNRMAQSLAKAFWPGALTLVIPNHPDLPKNLSPLPTVGVRMPDHPIALNLLQQTGPLATTSANRSGQPSPKTAQEVRSQLKGQIPLILDGGQTPGGFSSTVVDCTGMKPVILRKGPISMDQILAAVT